MNSWIDMAKEAYDRLEAWVHQIYYYITMK